MGKVSTPEKDRIRIRIEYLKHSEPYRRLCEWERDRKPGDPIPTEFHEGLRINYRRYGDIHGKDYSFDAWWNQNTFSWPVVEDYSKEIGADFDRYIEGYKQDNIVDPSIQEIREYLAKYLMKSPTHLYLKINVYGNETTEELTRLCKQFIEQRRADEEFMKLRESFDNRFEEDQRQRFTLKCVQHTHPATNYKISRPPVAIIIGRALQ